MRRDHDKISKKLIENIKKAGEPLETKEIEELLSNVTRVKIFYRLNLLRGDNEIEGKPVGSGKGTWIWWSKDAF